MLASKKKSIELFDKEDIKKLPLTYHYMVKIKKEEVTELNVNKKFSHSKEHLTKYYRKIISHKPISIPYEGNYSNEGN